MLRTLATLLLLANLAFWAYTQGHLSGLGLSPNTSREPERLARQRAPEKLTLLQGTDTATPVPEPPTLAPTASPQEAPTSVATPAPAVKQPTACWQASGLTPNQIQLVRATLQNLSGLPNDWTLTESVLPSRWIVYLGKFPDSEALQLRRTELRQAQIDHREVNTPALQPGLALGTYSTEEAARRALAETVLRGVDGVRVVQERQEVRSHTLRLPTLTEAQRRQITATDVLTDKPLQRCP